MGPYKTARTQKTRLSGGPWAVKIRDEKVTAVVFYEFFDFLL
jgi:hypothetical protein